MSVTVSTFAEVKEVLASHIPLVAGTLGAYRLDRMYPLLEQLDNPQNKFKAIHVAGTSGKTSTSYYIAALLKEAGKNVGLTVSPHVDQINERTQINLVPLPEKTYCNLFSEFMNLLEGLRVQPTYFELLMAFAYWVFAKQRVEYAVIEVGVGGLLDSTNVITRPDKICVITDIGMDHMHILGRTLPEITAQKAGIIRPYNVVFTYEQGETVMEVVREVCTRQQAELHEVLPEATKNTPTHLVLFQRRNWYLAWRVSRYILERNGDAELTDTQLAHSSHIYIPGRMEIIKAKGKLLVLDGAHNPQKMRALTHSLQNKFPRSSFAVLLAMGHNKTASLEETLQVVFSLKPHVIITGFGDPQSDYGVSMNPIKVAEAASLSGYDDWQVVGDNSQAFKVLLSRSEDILVVTGSLYFPGHLRSLIAQM
jgi:dihydrofolate synthase / folylpolyglutamate synthase